jgi:hypothetical protein
VVPPQASPGPLDQRSTNSSSTLVWPYNNALDHNAGYSSRSATIIKVEPLPAGTTDINVFEAGWDLLDQNKVVVYGALEPMDTTLTLQKSRSVMKRKKALVLTGSIGTANLGDRLVIEVLRPGSHRYTRLAGRDITAVNRSGGGTWRYMYKPKLRGTYKFRVRFDGDVAREFGRSNTVMVKVR